MARRQATVGSATSWPRACRSSRRHTRRRRLSQSASPRRRARPLSQLGRRCQRSQSPAQLLPISPAAARNLLKRRAAPSVRWGSPATARTDSRVEAPHVDAARGCASVLRRPRTAKPAKLPGLVAGSQRDETSRDAYDARRTLTGPCGSLFYGVEAARRAYGGKDGPRGATKQATEEYFKQRTDRPTPGASPTSPRS